ncbi:thiol:disulfide interchange protein DsbA/DsbL [Shewanella gelidii]|uniref:Thiol:disulfide interchange protein n=1 Tax=Shewanella gelidii TaxID=1642821 RepID=A0A917N6D6_9GAMM|nr:thiol:disulfide interchange protein DsbA/DsbL [Shewanella gelidii]MCL1096840.1 thiol:disulfide interchange protein DsbA/DsbL [Shewanella gelidii]GGI70530.1 thiol:disulfide interchange protein [Shewanella gelidii]
MFKNITLALAITFVSFTSYAANFVEGMHYVQVTEKPATKQPKLTEFFSFYCHNCYNMEANYIADIKANLNKNIQFDTKHVDYMNSEIGTEVMRSLAVINHLKLGSTMNQAMFAAIQGEGAQHGHNHGAPGDDHTPKINNRDEIKAVFKKYGIDTEQYDAIADSPETDAKLALWRSQQREFYIDGVPSFVINDKYKVNMDSIRTLGQLIDLINFLSLKTG